MRTDAQRNHDRILGAAGDLFAIQGVKVSVDEIARTAGVGVGTVHRHFPTKEQLLAAVLIAWCDPILDALALALDAQDPGDGLEAFLLTIVEFQSEHRALAEEMREMVSISPELAAIKERIGEGLGELVRRAQAAGQVRADVSPGDLSLLFAGLAQTASVNGTMYSCRDKVRFVRILLDGLRTPTPRPLPGPPPRPDHDVRT